MTAEAENLHTAAIIHRGNIIETLQSLIVSSNHDLFDN